jgi:hypothetical protein
MDKIQKTTDELESFTGKEWWVNLNGGKIRKNHGDLKGSFVSIGCWFNLFNNESMVEFNAMLMRLSPKDLKTARKEFQDAIVAAEKWKRDPDLWWLYDEANKQGDWSVQM